MKVCNARGREVRASIGAFFSFHFRLFKLVFLFAYSQLVMRYDENKL